MPQKIRDFQTSGEYVSVIHIATTGFDPIHDRIVEVAVVKLQYSFPVRRYHRLVRPDVRILAEATASHGVRESDVAEARTFEEIAPGLARFLGKSDLAGFDIRRFIVPFLRNEFDRNDVEFRWSPRSIVDVREIYHRYHPRDLGAAAREYLGVDRVVGVGSRPRAEAVAEILKAQLARHADLPLIARGLPCNPPGDPGGLFRPEGGHRVFAVGPHRGRTLEEVAELDPNYLRSLTGRERAWDSEWSISEALKKADARRSRAGRAPKGR